MARAPLLRRRPIEQLAPRKHWIAGAALLAFAALLVVLPVAAAATESPRLDVFDSFYRAGSLVFGGGHVVLPLLRAELVPHGWLTDEQLEEMQEKVKVEVDEAIEFAENAPEPTLDALYEDITVAPYIPQE